ncbi:hypothetical protein FRB95_007476 [Tulasnella sp. JGI-2019a]|nr:hypothetical protein FRB95_007476 [Tulasnella sp. JGI-2019a]
MKRGTHDSSDCKVYNQAVNRQYPPSPFSNQPAPTYTYLNRASLIIMLTIFEAPVDAHCGNSNCSCGESCGCKAGECKCTK